MTFCFLKLYGEMENGELMPPCYGQLIRAHLIPRQVIKRAGGNENDRRSWVPACGGLMGNGGHHGMLDHSKRLRLSRNAIPSVTEEFARELGLEWYLDRNYGPRPTCSS